MSAESNNPNEIGYQKRLNFVHKLFEEQLNLKLQKIEPIAYDAQCPFPYNNFIYLIDVDTKVTNQNNHDKQPGTDQIPDGLNKFVLRLSNPESGCNNETRVENEVAALSLAREALRDRLPNVVPQVFAWGSAAHGHEGWMLQEHKPGKSVFDEVPSLNEDELRKVLGQMADVLDCLQRYQVPSSIRGYGGLTFNEEGQIVAGQMSTIKAGPFETYDDFISAMIKDKLSEADTNPRINGWRDNGIRVRLDKFLQTGVKSTLHPITTHNDLKLVHADLTLDNLLFDPATKQLTAVVDFDFSHIGTISDEFFRSLSRDIGQFPDSRDGGEMLSLNKAMLHGFPDPLPSNTDEVNWTAAKIWNGAMRERQMHRPDNIPGIESLSNLFWLSSQISPWKLSNDVVARNSSVEKLREWKIQGEESLDKFLRAQGF